MAVRIAHIVKDSPADRLGWSVGDQIVSLNGHTVSDVIDFRFYGSDDEITVQIRKNGVLAEQYVDKEAAEPWGVEVEEFRIKTCGDDCVFCFVDQNPEGLRDALYFRDGDFRMSFLYGNYITMTNLRRRDMERIVEQRLSPLYISVHSTDDTVRRELMGHRAQDDRLMEKLRFLRDNRIEMHTQIVLVPGFNDGEVLRRSVDELFDLGEAVQSVSVVPVGLTAHRNGLRPLRLVEPAEARDLITKIHEWQDRFRAKKGRGFVYPSDELYLLAGLDFPDEEAYDGYPLMENGVGMSRDFINELTFQQEDFPAALDRPRKLTMITGNLAAPVLERWALPALRRIRCLDVDLVEAQNLLFGPSVTVSGLLNFRSFHAALEGRDSGDLILLPPDSVNFEGDFLDNVPGRNTPDDLARALGVPVHVFDGDWVGTLELLEDPVPVP